MYASIWQQNAMAKTVRTLQENPKSLSSQPEKTGQDQPQDVISRQEVAGRHDALAQPHTTVRHSTRRVCLVEAGPGHSKTGLFNKLQKCCRPQRYEGFAVQTKASSIQRLQDLGADMNAHC